MGGAASKAAASAAPKAAAKAAAASTTKKSSGPLSEFSRSAVVVSHLDISNRDLNGASLMRNPNAPEKPVEIIEMNRTLLDDMKKFEEYEKVDYLVQDSTAFQDTASAYRARSSTPTTLPQDRTAAASTVFGGEVVDHIPGRLSNRNLRELLRLHYEDPTAWSSVKLAEHFVMDVDVVRSILKNVGPADVLEPRAAAEFPFGVWFVPTPSKRLEL
uniref:NADH dehydrogenase [ubiquinone] 1 alpha subcomplex assembly factor 4 n=1 Tax=Globisporangium ultimum (strain ATCC 200006 / CBS 805.95 / DAOM BR144) TaxID=431595 RepID=K3X592_GLOUD